MEIVKLTKTEIVNRIKATRPNYYADWYFERLLDKLCLGEMDQGDLIARVNIITGEIPIQPTRSKHLHDIEKFIISDLKKQGYTITGDVRYYFKLSNRQLDNLQDLAGEVYGDFFVHVPVERKRKVKLFSWLGN